jgi:hypothetical protein
MNALKYASTLAKRAKRSLEPLANPCSVDVSDRGPGEAGSPNEALADADAEVPWSPATSQKLLAVRFSLETRHVTSEVMKSAFNVPARIMNRERLRIMGSSQHTQFCWGELT